MKKKILFILLGIVILGGIYGLYSTFALSSSATGSTSYTFDVSNYTVDGTTSILIPGDEGGKRKKIVYRVNNPNNGTLKYGVVYSRIDATTNATVTTGVAHVEETGFDNPVGTINKDENKFVLIEVDSSGKDNILKLKTVFGYVNGGDLVVPDGYTLLS